MGFLSVLSFAHMLVQQRTGAGDTAIDATSGNGNDALFLARLVGPAGKLYAFDIQEAALHSTRSKLAEAGIVANASGVMHAEGAEDEEKHSRVRLIRDSHAQMELHLPPEEHGAIAAVMFNLGYLPGADTAVITLPHSTLPALDAAFRLLRRGGVLTVVLYPGHAGGQEEADAVEAWASALPQQAAQSLLYRFANRQKDAPYLVAVEKRA